ncbi:MAG: DUF427 domain-containing protein [Chloroflexi bacterium]|nr:DUF427 domain-containing protein [Chloroflexota bacterium]MCC6893605.1 DUF427 domain-containing protein [Anaerolineae bacterium]
MSPIQRQEPLAGQESVWDYPRPPRVEPTGKHVRVVFNGVTIADTTRAIRVLETSHPPAYYIPPADIRMEYLTTTPRSTFCEFKGAAGYWTVKVNGRVSENFAWSYRSPNAGYEAIKNYIAIYPSKVDACFVNDERVTAQEGDFYGGWITAEIVGPFKGGAGTWGW